MIPSGPPALRMPLSDLRFILSRPFLLCGPLLVQLVKVDRRRPLQEISQELVCECQNINVLEVWKYVAQRSLGSPARRIPMVTSEKWGALAGNDKLAYQWLRGPPLHSRAIVAYMFRSFIVCGRLRGSAVKTFCLSVVTNCLILIWIFWI